jgi:hypothetical protein
MSHPGLVIAVLLAIVAVAVVVVTRRRAGTPEVDEADEPEVRERLAPSGAPPSAAEEPVRPAPRLRLARAEHRTPTSGEAAGPEPAMLAARVATTMAADEPAGPDTAELSWLDELSGRAHGRVLRALGATYLALRPRVDEVADAAARDAGRELLERLLRTMGSLGEQDPRERWMDQELVPLLDRMGAVLSLAARAGRADPGAAALAAALDEALHRDVDAAATAEGWFGVERVVPFATRFDPARHYAIGGRAEPGFAGTVVEIRKVGRVDARGRHVLALPDVVVGTA